MLSSFETYTANLVHPAKNCNGLKVNAQQPQPASCPAARV
jgi:hypothetical protein